jgi:sulfate adenylyltransferase
MKHALSTPGPIAPHGGRLVDLLLSDDEAREHKLASRDWLSWDLTPRQLCDLELLMNGAFSPLRGFLTRRDYDGVVADMRLAGGVLWPIPIVLDVPEAFADRVATGDRIALRDAEGVMLAALRVEDAWRPDREEEAVRVYGTTDPHHPGVDHLLHRTHPVYLGGRVEGVQRPVHPDFRLLRRTPAQLRAEFDHLGWKRVVAFQTRNPMHRAHVELTRRAAEEVNGNLLLHPVTGLTKPGDIDHFTRVRAYQAVLQRYPARTAQLSLLQLAMRMAGPREALWHALIRKNHGCTHFIVGRDHAGPGAARDGSPTYPPYAAQEMLRVHEREIGIRMTPFRALVYREDTKRYVPIDEVPDGAPVLNVSGTEMRRRLATGEPLPGWFTFPEVAEELAKTHRPPAEQGLAVFFTGLSGAGKSTLARALSTRLREIGGRNVTLLDGDHVRKLLSSELGFSREHRDLNILRIGYVAAEVARHGGLAICAPIAPYEGTREEARRMIEEHGGFLLVHVATPLEVCEARDRKGLYAKARAGIIKEFTGISDTYEAPSDADLTIDTTDLCPAEAVERIVSELAARGYVEAPR